MYTNTHASAELRLRVDADVRKGPYLINNFACHFENDAGITGLRDRESRQRLTVIAKLKLIAKIKLARIPEKNRCKISARGEILRSVKRLDLPRMR
jgi:hypothetical protein